VPEVPRPENWGGYLFRHEEVEFWQGQRARMHDRFLYTRDAGGWRIDRLAP
jgi:pyridoxamine 5'-phosphate oxidase